MYCVAQETEAGPAAAAAQLPERRGSELVYSAEGIPAEPLRGRNCTSQARNPGE